MTLQDRITHDIAEAMKAREQGRLSALRMAKAALMNASVSKGRDLEEGEAQQVVVTLIKQRRGSVGQIGAGGGADLGGGGEGGGGGVGGDAAGGATGGGSRPGVGGGSAPAAGPGAR